MTTPEEKIKNIPSTVLLKELISRNELRDGPRQTEYPNGIKEVGVAIGNDNMAEIFLTEEDKIALDREAAQHSNQYKQKDSKMTLSTIPLEEEMSDFRNELEQLKNRAMRLAHHPDVTNQDSNLSGNNMPGTEKANKLANLTLVFRHLEDARMRCGKVMQAYQGGVSCFDKSRQGGTPDGR